MIPTLLVLGLVVGLAVGGTSHRLFGLHVAVPILVAVSLAWGLMVGMAADDLSTGVSGAAIAGINAAVGAAVPLAALGLARRATHR